MDCKTLADVGLTAAIALFAGLTWQATRTYAYIAGVTLFVQASKDISGVSQGVDTCATPFSGRKIRLLGESR